MEAVKIDPKAINYMKVIPTEKVQTEALKREPSLLSILYKLKFNIARSLVDKVIGNGKIGRNI